MRICERQVICMCCGMHARTRTFSPPGQNSCSGRHQLPPAPAATSRSFQSETGFRPVHIHMHERQERERERFLSTGLACMHTVAREKEGDAPVLNWHACTRQQERTRTMLEYWIGMHAKHLSHKKEIGSCLTTRLACIYAGMRFL